MQCPVCTDQRLSMSERQGIEIDYCPSCRGVWLDRGELDKIVERSMMAAVAEVEAEERERSFATSGSGYDRQPPKKKKASSLLGDLFDF